MAGNIYSIEKSDNGALQAIELPTTQMSSVDDLKIRYGVSLELTEAGVTFARGEIDPGTEVPAHAGPNLYGLYVVSGSGTLTLTDDDGKILSEVPYDPDDLIVFEPGAMHGWRNSGDTVMKWFGVDILER